MLEGDKLLTTQLELETHILQFYPNLYTKDEQVKNNEAAREDCFMHLKHIVTAEHNEELLKPLTMEELSAAMKELPQERHLEWIPSQQNSIKNSGKILTSIYSTSSPKQSPKPTSQMSWTLAK